MSSHPLTSSDIVKRAHAVGTYYGFTPFSALAHQKRGKKSVEPFPEGLDLNSLDPAARDTAQFLKQIRDAGITPSATQPLFVWHTNAAAGRAAPKQILIQFHALGVERAIADAVLIRAVRSLIGELGKDEPRVRINSMGDKETRGRLTRELGQFFRKHAPAIPADCAECAKRDALLATELITDEELRGELPSPTDHLSENSRKHFESVLEYLEETETPYELAPEIFSRGSSWTETCFEVHGSDDMRAWGSRYSELTRPFFKSAIPSIGAVIRITTESRSVIPPMKEHKTPRFAFVHIGDEAKRESIKMADSLRHARIPMMQSIGIESLTEQMRLAEVANPPYLIIMGRKEALERSVILRERSSHTETFIPFDSLIDHLKEVA
ncbi:MAG: histidine--tRNA ligase [Parcubacteria bacterium C7867-001]|nr:MAG: histidine--tRNA ligase [Parcubacteria bacterium C7867-001]